ncbi:hypothetical protein INT45_012481 [Circinella minor]|uniref:Uncharacterized protein n=1 Tax=Circinella minor TaxID=1195481 RepID=A0A8H7RTD3_9FUNG|nr:hypothetical protein INT45_012481 [Circinella minor]
MITTISDAVSMTTLTHNGSLSIGDFERRCIRLYTCIKIRSNKLTPEIDYQERRPHNVCQRCFCLNRVCYNFRLVIVDGESMDGNWCDQCRLNKRSGCSNLTYHESGSGQVPMSHAWLLTRSTDVPALVFPAWYLSKVLRSRRSGTPMVKVCSLNELQIGRKISPNHVPPVLPVFQNGKIANYGTFGSTASGSRNTRVGIIVPSETSSRISLESTQVNSNQVASGSLVRRRSRRLAGNLVSAAYTELEEEQDELESESGIGNDNNNNQVDEYPFGSDESDYQWDMTPVSHGTINAMGTPDPQLFLDSVIPLPLVSPPIRPSDQESVSSSSLLSIVPGNSRHNLVFHGGPVIPSGGRRFSAPAEHVGISDELHINPQFFASNPQSWHGDGPRSQDANHNLPPPPNSPSNVPNSPTLNQDQRGVAELEALNPLRPLFTLPTLESGRGYVIRVRGAVWG